MSTLSVSLLGKFCARRGGQELAGFEARKVQELFCYLLIHRDRSHPREFLASVLWGDSSTAQSKKSLRQILWRLQSTLDATAKRESQRVLLADPERVQINADADLWLDVALFEQSWANQQGMPGDQLDVNDALAIRRAVDMYQGDLLEGCYVDWCLYERERLQNLFVAMLDKLMLYCEKHSQYEAGLDYGRRILQYDRAHERTHQRLMRLHYLVGDRVAALRQYEHCIDALSKELNVGPARDTVMLYRQIQGDELDSIAPMLSPTSPTPTGDTTSWPEILDRLKLLSSILADVQRQVQRDILSAERLLNHTSPPQNDR